MATLEKLGSEISTMFLILSLPVALVLSNYNAGKTVFRIYHELVFLVQFLRANSFSFPR